MLSDFFMKIYAKFFLFYLLVRKYEKILEINDGGDYDGFTTWAALIYHLSKMRFISKLFTQVHIPVDLNRSIFRLPE